MLINAKNIKLDKNPKFKSIIAIDFMIMENVIMGAIFFWFLKFTGLTFSNDELTREYNKSTTFI